MHLKLSPSIINSPCMDGGVEVGGGGGGGVTSPFEVESSKLHFSDDLQLYQSE